MELAATIVNLIPLKNIVSISKWGGYNIINPSHFF
jgi:hypothetical protein